MLHVAVLVAVLHLQRLLHLGHHRLEQRGVAAQRVVVVGAEDGAVGDPDRHPSCAWPAKTVNTFAPSAAIRSSHRLLRAAAQRHHGDHRAHADDDAQHGEHRPQLVGPDRLEGDRERLARAAWLSAPRRRACAGSAASAAACRARAPPPVIRLIRSLHVLLRLHQARAGQDQDRIGRAQAAQHLAVVEVGETGADPDRRRPPFRFTKTM